MGHLAIPTGVMGMVQEVLSHWRTRTILSMVCDPLLNKLSDYERLIANHL